MKFSSIGFDLLCRVNNKMLLSFLRETFLGHVASPNIICILWTPRHTFRTFAPIATAHLWCASYSLVTRVPRHFQARAHSRPQSLRSFWPKAGIERLWEQPFQACAIDEDFVNPDGQNSVISFVISKWLLPELSIPAAGQKDRRLWGRECN